MEPEMAALEPEMAALEPEALDALLRAELGRPLVVVGLTLAAGAATGAGLDTPLGEPPAGPIAGLARYGELWVRWLAAGTRLADALGRAAVLDADALLILGAGIRERGVRRRYGSRGGGRRGGQREPRLGARRGQDGTTGGALAACGDGRGGRGWPA